MRRGSIAFAIVLGLVIGLVPAAPASGAVGWTTSTLVPGSTAYLDSLAISGNRVVWVQGTLGESDTNEIYTRVMGGAAPENVSDRAALWDNEPAVSGNRIAWTGQTANGRDVFTWTLGDSSATPVTDDGFRTDQQVRVSGNRLFWSGATGGADSNLEIYTWAPGDLAPTNVSNNLGSAVNDESPRVSGDRVVWVGWDAVGGDWDIYTWAVSDPVKRNLSSNTVDDASPDISGDRVVWYASDGNDYEIYTRVVGGSGPANISNRDGVDDYTPRISGDRVVWEGAVNGTSNDDVFMFVLGSSDPTNLSNSPSEYDSGPVVAGDYVAWSVETAADAEIYAWTPSGVLNVSDNTSADYAPVISEDGIAWINRIDGSGDSLFSIQIAQPTVTAATVVPVAGTNRIGTAIQASKLAFASGSVDTVVIATALNWPDALGGAALAGAVDGPILLTNPTSLAPEVVAEIARLGANHAYILGGPSAVGAGVETALKGKLGAGNVKRLAGAGRYETARLIAAETVSALGATYDGNAFLATGANFPDALGASPLAAANGWPIYLVNPATGADATLKAALASDGADNVLVLGGTGVISDAVKNGLGVKSTQRLSGDNRYDTARAVAMYGTGPAGGLSWNRLAIATGENFPDALAGGVLQGKSGSVLLLTPSKSLNGGVAGVLTANKGVIGEVRFLGGEGAISTPVRTAVANALK